MTVPSAQRIVGVSATLAVSGRCRYMGFVAQGTADAAADVTLYDDIRATAAQALDYVNFVTIGGDRQWYGPQGIVCEAGIFVGTITGALTIILYYIPQTVGAGGVLIDESSDQRVIHVSHSQVEIDNALAGVTP